MNSRRLWNSHQRHKFLRAEASGDILKFRVSEMAFPGVFKRYLPPQMLCCFIRILATLGTIPSKYRRHSTHGICVQCHSKWEHGCFTILFNGAYFLLAVMIEGDESSRLRMANQPVILAGYQPLLTALNKLLEVIGIFTHTVNFTATTVESSFSNTIVRCIIEQTIW